MAMGYITALEALDASKSYVAPRGQECKELLHAEIEPRFFAYDTPAREIVADGKQSRYLLGELAWYFSGNPDIDAILPYSKFWANIAKYNRANSNYGYLTLYEQDDKTGYTPAGWCVNALLNDRHTRQAVALYNKPHYVEETKDFICTQLQQFMIRDGELHTSVYIRSSDAIRGLSFDIPWYRTLQHIIANSYNAGCSDRTEHIAPGGMHISIASLHVYKEHYGLLKYMVDDMVHGRCQQYDVTTGEALATIRQRGRAWDYSAIKQAIYFKHFADYPMEAY